MDNKSDAVVSVVAVSLVVIGIILLIVSIMAAGAALFGAVLWAAWNFVAVPLFGATAVTFLQACVAGLAVSFVGGCFRATVVKARD